MISKVHTPSSTVQPHTGSTKDFRTEEVRATACGFRRANDKVLGRKQEKYLGKLLIVLTAPTNTSTSQAAWTHTSYHIIRASFPSTRPTVYIWVSGLGIREPGLRSHRSQLSRLLLVPSLYGGMPTRNAHSRTAVMGAR